MLERGHLEILRALGEDGTLTTAARRLCLSQPALSHRIGKLEEQLKVSLWEKDGRGVRLTQAGRHLSDLSLRILPDFEHAEKSVRAFAEGKKGLLRIGVECYPCFEWLLNVIRGFLRELPDVDIDVVQRFQFSGHEAMANRQIDLLITADPQAKGILHYEPLFDYELLLAAARKHPLSKKEFVVPEDFPGQTVLTYPVEPERLDLFVKFLNPASVAPGKRVPIEATEVMLQMVSAGRGVCTLPDWIVEKHRRELGLVGIRLGAKGIRKRLYAAIRKSDGEIGYIREFLAFGKRGSNGQPRISGARNLFPGKGD